MKKNIKSPRCQFSLFWILCLISSFIVFSRDLMQSRYVGGIHETRASDLISTLLRWQGYHYARFAFELNQKILFFIFSLICESISNSWIASKHGPTGISWRLSFLRHVEIYFFPNIFQHDLSLGPFWRISDHPPSNRSSWFLSQPSSAFWLF